MIRYCCNTFKPNVPFLRPLKTYENQKFYVFRGYRKKNIDLKWVNIGDNTHCEQYKY